MRFTSPRLDEPADLRVIAALEAVGAGRSTVQLPTMSPSFRAELRTQLVAVAPRLVAEGVRPGTETAPRPAARRADTAASTATDSDRPARSGRTARPARTRTRPMTVLVAGAAIVVLGAGGVTWLSRDALPGDALYGLKRTAEGVDVSLSGNDVDKGTALLLGATKRVNEVKALIGRPQAMALGTGPSAAGGLSDSTIKLVVSTLRTADTDTQKGVTLIGEDAVERSDAAGLTVVVGWAKDQRALIDGLVTAIPTDNDARKQAQESATNIRRGLDRAEKLLTDYTDKTCRRSSDDFGPTPCLASTPTTTNPSGPASTAPTSGATTSNPGGGVTVTPPPTSPPGAVPSTTTTGAAAGRTPSAPGAGAASSTAPAVAVGTCGLGVNLPVATVSLGTCTPTP